MSATLNDDVLADLEAPTRSGDPDQDFKVLLVLAALLRSLLMLRLHRASDDFGATEGLRVVESAIAIVIAEAALKA